MNISIFKVLFFISFSFIHLSCATQKNTILAPDAPSQRDITPDNQLKILSWNIKMLPAPYGWFLKRHERADNIIQFLKESELYDIIFFQEAFSGSIRSKIYAGLKYIYPHQVEPDDQTAFYKINSGLWVISRLPITLKNHISFTQIMAWDKLASKGAKLFSVIKDEQAFHLINTHMQSDYAIDYSDIRSSQYTEINTNLLLPYEKSEVPLILCGDLNISRPAKLKKMLEKLKLRNGPLLGNLQYSTLGNNKHLIDYILMKGEENKIKMVKRRIIDFSSMLKGKESHLSDHYPIEAVVSW